MPTSSHTPGAEAVRGVPAAGVPAAGAVVSCQGSGIALPAVPADWCELVPAGTCHTRDGRGPYHLADAAAVVAAFAADFPPGSDQAAPVDYAHDDVLRAPGTVLPPAAGWLAELRLADSGAIEGRIEWTDQARERLAAREYRYLSPELLVDPKTGTIVGLSGAGLTHRPNLYLRALSARALPPRLEPQMDDELLERLRYLFNLPTLATPAEIAAEVARLIERLKTADGAVTETAGATAAPADRLVLLTERLAAVSPGLATLRTLCAVAPEAAAPQVLAAAQQRITDLSDTLATRDAEQQVAQALRARLIDPAKREWAQGYARSDPRGFATYLQGCTPLLTARTVPAGLVDPAGSDFDSLVVATMAADKVSRGAAMMTVAGTHPEAHRAWIESTQPQPRQA